MLNKIFLSLSITMMILVVADYGPEYQPLTLDSVVL
jgi:hypothetical protein